MPIRPTWLILLFAATYPWAVVALVATLGAVVGTIPLYEVAIHAQRTRRVQAWLARRWVQRLLRWLKGKDFLTIVVIVVSPLPDQLIGIVGGVRRYPMGKFLLANFVGRFAFYAAIAYLGALGATRFGSPASWVLPVLQL
jgi:membrane protein YqaA with SNARE-associated domain